MLARLSIRDIVLIERLDLEFSKGLAVLTGETGAGKSILLDAFALALVVEDFREPLNKRFLLRSAPLRVHACSISLNDGRSKKKCSDSRISGVAPETTDFGSISSVGL